MKKEPNKKLIGLFAVAGMVLFIGVILLLGRNDLFLDNDRMRVLYFEESVNNLRIGSPAVFRGVEVGKVVRIDLRADMETLTFRIPVYVQLDKMPQLEEGGRLEDEEKLRLFVEKGLRARLARQNFLTGQLMVEFEMLPHTPVVYRELDPKAKIMEIPTVVSPLGEFSKGLQDVPIKEISEGVNALLKNLNKDLPGILKNFEAFSGRLTDPTTADNLNRTLKDIGEAAKALRNFADYIERHPEALLRGKGKY